MTQKVFSIDTLPGVQRDGTFLDKNYYTDGKWVRFQRAALLAACRWRKPFGSSE